MSINLKLNLTDAQRHKLHQGSSVQIKNDQIGSGQEFKLHKANAKKIIKALKSGSGCRLELDEHEIQGSGIFGKKADRWFKKVGIHKAVYKVGDALKPLAHQGIKELAQVGSAYGIPTAGLESVAHKYIDDPEAVQAQVRDGINTARSIAGVGVRRIRGKGFNKYMPVRGNGMRTTVIKQPLIPERISGSGIKQIQARTHVRDDQSNFIASDNANFYPVPPQSYKNIQKGIQKIGGGSFKVAGGSFIAH